MSSFNQLILMGHLTRDPELRYTQKGTCIANGGIAVNRTWTSESGEKKESVTFVDYKAFGRTAEVIGQYLKKGHATFLVGRLDQETWDDKQTGQKKSKLVMAVERFSFLNNNPRADGERPAARTSAPKPEPSDNDGNPLGEPDDVPF